ncbi:hypothetical protein COV06_00955 [Candidatus Uhrbacteria bacterium CG10_big_fil_rev_8_21_14_0_10_50_16]|uniref:Glycosyltransferase family 1 protein n=1 Tax=Candidatus Uhrbacteria bacterium CG10_big_fil_rev_8_21_14_0_10_50_16 TaxID=1975039 RepID=A0A2H0RPP1_9BACT|nr:MAG: hypothetical protein COV06_00955 [Candidatus Uhrbacteria bacterium CG10_big_fil_rev_8_21_14_0_10_50_16]
MKFLTITIDYLPMPGGVARYIDTFCEAFGSSMHVVADIGDVQTSVCDKTFSVEYRQFMQQKWPRWMGAVHELAKRDVDLIFTHHVLPLGIACLMNKRRTNTEYVVVLHGMDFDLATRNMWKRWITRQVLREARAVVTNTHALAQRVERFVHVEPLVVHPQPYVQAAKSISSNTFSIVSVGRLVERKGIQRVLNALTLIPHLHDQLHYSILGGDGPFKQELERMIIDLGMEDLVTLTVDPTDEQIQYAYKTSQLFVLPTVTTALDREGFGIVYHEAAQFGIPSIASNIPGVDEAVINGQTGILVNSDQELIDAMTTLFHNEELRKTLGDNAREHVRTSRAMIEDLKQNLGL